MKEKLKAYFTSDVFYNTATYIADKILDITEPLIKQWLGTVIGQRWLKWLTDVLVSRFYDQILRVLTTVGIIRLGYYYDVHDAENSIKKLHKAEDANDDELYMRTLNDALRTNRLPKP